MGSEKAGIRVQISGVSCGADPGRLCNWRLRFPVRWKRTPNCSILMPSCKAKARDSAQKGLLFLSKSPRCRSFSSKNRAFRGFLFTIEIIERPSSLCSKLMIQGFLRFLHGLKCAPKTDVSREGGWVMRLEMRSNSVRPRVGIQTLCAAGSKLSAK